MKKKKKKYNTCITKLICYLYRVHQTAEHIYLKQKKNQNSLVYCIKIALAHPGYEKEKLCQTKSFILLLHILPYKTATKMRWPKHYALYYIITVKNWWNHIEQLYKNKGPKNWVNLYRTIELNPLCVCTCIYFCVMFYKCTFIALAFVPWIFLKHNAFPPFLVKLRPQNWDTDSCP